ncbi:hypothetical protein [uncultured Anaerococcus sp.]|uniref:hypothetical protein n=1 Tax=uncultured Anaerococcus sp. TaxID=293428 RepID=UPI00261ED88A|nr:hypothetical protein [uncultured Anaerococcus sp.]
MKKKTQFALIYSLAILIFFMIKDKANWIVHSIPIIIMLAAASYYKKYLKYRDNYYIPILILAVILFGGLFIQNGLILNNLSINLTIYWMVSAILSFIIINYFLYE